MIEPVVVEGASSGYNAWPLLHPGRQLFVDDLLIERTDLTRVWKEPVKFSGNPVLKPETPLEKGLEGHCPMAAPFSGGVWYDDADGLYKCWYCAGWFDGTAYAWSTNGLDWVRPDLAAEPGTNRVIPRRGERDSASVVLDPDAADGNRFKMLVWSRPQGGELFVSKNGTDWSEPTGWGNRWGDRSTIFRDPFRNLWVYSIRYSYPRRMRGRVETADFLAGAKLDKRAFKGNWFVPQTNEVGVYNVDCVAYESVMLAAVTVMTGPDNGHWMKCGLPKKTDLHLAFSRNGVDFTRAPDAFLKGTRRSGDWDYGYLHSNSGVCLVRDDELWFYYTGFAGDTNRLENVPAKNGMYANASMGIAKLRRDGFCAMEGAGELVTKELPVSGRHLFVNAKGRLTVKVGDTTVGTFDGDSTRAQVADLSAFRGKSVRLTFALTAGELYSFWTTDDPAGRSGGYLAGGSPEATGLRDR